MSSNETGPAGAAGQGRKTRRIIAGLLVGLLALSCLCCLATSLVGNAGTAGWALWTRRQLEQAQQRTQSLESEIERLQEILLESGVDIPLAPADVATMETIQARVVDLRGLEPTHAVERTLMTQDQLRDYMLEDFEEEFPAQEARNDTLALAAFDFVDPDLDLRALLIDLYTEQVAGFYDAETEQIYVIANFGLMGPTAQSTYAHEFVHVLQDQHFDLEAMLLGEDVQDQYDSDYLTAVRALVEGDATLAQFQYLGEHLTAEEYLAFIEEQMEIDTSVLDQVPTFIRDSLFFPYEHGQPFVTALYERGGWDAVDQAYADPPRSSEQILHPERYWDGDAPQLISLPPLTDTLGSGWQLADEELMGEFGVRSYLAQQVGESDAHTAAEGWDGDWYAVHYRPADEALLLAWHVVWDTSGDVEEFVDAYVAYAEGRFGHPADLMDGPRLCWEGHKDTGCLTWGASDTTIVLGPDLGIVELVLEAVR